MLGPSIRSSQRDALTCRCLLTTHYRDYSSGNDRILAMSVSNICECGSKVIFDEEGSYIEDNITGERTPLYKRNGVYVMDMRIRKNRERLVE